MADSGRDKWISASAAARLLGTNVHNVLKLAAMGRVRTKAEPGCSIRYSREDVEAEAQAHAKAEGREG